MKKPAAQETTGTFRRFTKNAVYNLGLLDAYHRIRNKGNLTTVMFHRVLPQTSGAWCTADWQYTLSTETFAACLAFFRIHYNVISLEQLVAAATNHTALPSCPMLITLDDGWSDTLEYAAPILQKMMMPALCFVASDPIDEPAARWWQEAFDCEWRAHRIDEDGIRLAWNNLHQTPPPNEQAPSANSYLRCLTMLQELPEVMRDDILNQRSETAIRNTARQMLDPQGVTSLPIAGVAVGAHGASHLPLIMSRNPSDELIRAKHRLEELTAGTTQLAVTALSFPHGRYSSEVVQLARAVGYKFIFNSDPYLSQLRQGLLNGDTFGRIEISPTNITDPMGRFEPERMAMHLFFRAAN